MSCPDNGQPCGSCGGFCSQPTTLALGWPKNIAHATAPHQAMLARFAQRAAQVIALSGTGEELTADLAVTEGHRHNSDATIIEWRQLAAWPLIGRTLTNVVTVGQVVNSFGFTKEDLGLYVFRMPLDAGGLRVRDVFYPRIRVTVPSTGGIANSTLIVTGDLVRFVAGVLTVVSALPPLNISAQGGPPVISYTNRWFTWGAIEIPAALTDARFGLRLRAQVGSGAGERGEVFEVAVGLRGGL